MHNSNYKQMRWICPRCARVLSPYVDFYNCNEKVTTSASVSNNKNTYIKPEWRKVDPYEEAMMNQKAWVSYYKMNIPVYLQSEVLGWACPQCHRVFSSLIGECPYCNNKNITYSTHTNTATTASDSNIGITAWSSTCIQDCKACDKYEKTCFGGVETTNQTIISHRRPPEVNFDWGDSALGDTFIKHFQDRKEN